MTGRVSDPIVTSQTVETSNYIMDFAETGVLILGEAENWEQLRPALATGTRVIATSNFEKIKRNQQQ